MDVKQVSPATAPVVGPKPAVPAASPEARRSASDALTVSSAAKTAVTKVPVPADPFANVETYKQSADAVETNLRSAKAVRGNAEQNRANVDQSTQQKLDGAVRARDTKNAAAIQPLNAAKQDCEATRAKLQAPIDQTQDLLGKARWDLEIATHPNKVELDRARVEAHNTVGQAENSLGQQQQYLAEVDRSLDRAGRDLAGQQVALAQTQANLGDVSTRLDATAYELNNARRAAPRPGELENAYARVQADQADFTTATNKVNGAEGEVTHRRRVLNGMLDDNAHPATPPSGDRPTPPSAGGGNDRPTPPSATHPATGTTTRPTPPGVGPSTPASRPTPPSVNDRPVPPAAGGTHSDTEIRQARTDLAQAESTLTTLQARLDSARSELDAAQRSYGDKQARADRVASLQGQVQQLQGDINGLQSQVMGYQNNIATLRGNIRDLEGDRQTGQGNQSQAVRNLDDARGQAQRLDQTPYDQGEPANIKKAGSKVTGLEHTLTTHQSEFTDGMKPPTERVNREQATYDSSMAPFHQAVGDAQNERTQALAGADQTLGSARDGVNTAQHDYDRVKDAPTGKRMKWDMPRFLGGSGFSVDKFWKDRPVP